MMKKKVIAVAAYCFMISVTFGYIQNYKGCLDYGRNCSVDTTFGIGLGATLWPAYWLYHSGTLMFKSIKEE